MSMNRLPSAVHIQDRKQNTKQLVSRVGFVPSSWNL